MTMTKAIINLELGVLELEGSEKFVADHLEKYSHLLLPKTNSDEGKSAQGKTVPAKTKKGETATKNSRNRSGGKRTGPSGGDRIRALKGEDYFSDARSLSDVVKKLEEKATPYAAKHVSASLAQEVKVGNLRRMKKDGVWVYINP